MKTPKKKSAKKKVTAKKATPNKSQWEKRVSASGKTYYTRVKTGTPKQPKFKKREPIVLKKKNEHPMMLALRDFVGEYNTLVDQRDELNEQIKEIDTNINALTNFFKNKKK